MRRNALSIMCAVTFLLQPSFAAASPQPSGRIWVLPYFTNGRGVVAIQNTSTASSNFHITPQLAIRPADPLEGSSVKLSWLNANKKKVWAVAAGQTKTFVLTVEGAEPGKSYIVSRRSGGESLDVGTILVVSGDIPLIPDALNDSYSACVDHNHTDEIKLLTYRSGLFRWVKVKGGRCSNLATGLYREVKSNGSIGRYFTPMKDAVPVEDPSTASTIVSS